jgi:competence protein ComEC
MSKREIILIIFLAIIASVRYLFFIPKAPDFDYLLGDKISVTAQIVENPDERLNSQQLKVKINNQKIYLLVSTNKSTEYKYGDNLYIEGNLSKPENFITTQGKEFNYVKYLANQDIYFLLKYPEIKIISRDNGNFLYSFLYKIKNSFIKSINKVIDLPESSLAGGLILGLKGGFDEDTRNNLIETGTIHIVALSGYNVSIIAEGVMKTFKQIFSQNISVVLGITTILLFVILTGAESTAVRAGIMAIIMLIGRMTGRKYLAGRALVIAALLMITYDPRIVTDMSFQLSFIATAGVLFLPTKILKYFSFLPVRFGIREMIVSTVSATISVLPLILYSTGVLSLVSLFVNSLILLFIPYAMLFVFIAGALGLISKTIALPFGFIAYLILHYILSAINIFGSFKFSSFTIQSFPLIITIALYLILFWWIFVRKNKLPTQTDKGG